MAINIRKFCKCGVKLERSAPDDETARQIVEQFRQAHSGYDHGPATYAEYRHKVSQIVASNARSNRSKEALPLLTEIARAHSRQSDIHDFINQFGMEVCSRCLVVRGRVETSCIGRALMKPGEFIGYPLPWMR